MEVWKNVFEYENFYEACSTGIVRRKTTGRILAIKKRGDYFSVHLCQNGIRKKESLHRIIAFTFLRDYFKPGLVVNHKDGNTFNNAVDNLEWVTQSENIIHSFKILNRRSSHAKYVLNISTGIFYDTIEEAAKTTNYSYQSIRHKLSGKWPNNTFLSLI